MMSKNERLTIERAVALLDMATDVCCGVQETAGDRPCMWEHGHIAALVGIALEDLRELVPVVPAGTGKPHAQTGNVTYGPRSQQDGF